MPTILNETPAPGPAHPERRTEALLRLAEEYADAHSVAGVTTREGGIMRALVEEVMKGEQKRAEAHADGIVACIGWLQSRHSGLAIELDEAMHEKFPGHARGHRQPQI